MTRYIDLVAAKKQVAETKVFNKGKLVVGVKAIAPVKGLERKGTVVYRRKVEYGNPFMSEN
ncbi:hypothetical protein [Sporosarcina highlanderae]|uniref:Uncharacterized protein n=1 Tax=Sporosarcina highlanderae TaxID=3035916 RepID=A0ABT8JSQ7_9BACL|nr:hypothetical protein [Sporosarcina highlanderae]MDN4608193.1 hypothetical protein [Sporosarcina highlanderae]